MQLETGIGNIDLLSGGSVFVLEFADDFVLLCDTTQAMHFALNQLRISVGRYGMCFQPPKCKVLLQDWDNPESVLNLGT